jgi:CubicO group peptidase (beta-lactamase class C family)
MGDGRSPSSEDTLQALLERGRDDDAFRGAAAAVGTVERPPTVTTVGFATDDASTPVTETTLFDVASLTKPIVTATVALRLMERGELDLTATVGEYVPRAEGTDRGSIPIRSLLTHTSGLPPYKSFPFGWESKDALLESLYDSPIGVMADPDEWFVYSDLNFVYLGDVLRHCTGSSLRDLATRHVFDPLNLDDATLGPVEDVEAVAMTEDRQWRERRLQGEIHDYIGSVLEGEGGNAGLFASVESIARVGRMLLKGGSIDGTQVLAPSTVSSLRRDHVTDLKRPHGLGWRLANEGAPSLTWSPESFGHTGFTGTSLWIDPDREVYAALLTNRLLTDPSGDAIVSFRTAFHNAVMANTTGTTTQ